LPVLALCALVLLTYSNSFRSGFVFDNAWVILEDSRVHAATAGNIERIFTSGYTEQSSLFRPLTTLSFLVDYAVLGDGSRPAGYHWTNLGIHAANAALAFWLGMLLFREMGAHRRTAAFALAALWAVHPVLTDSVTNIVGRADLLAALGVLAGLLSHRHAADASGRRRLAWLVALMAAAGVAVFSKESGVVLVAVMAIYDFAFAREAFRNRLAGYAALTPPFLLFFILRWRALSGQVSLGFPFTDNPLVGAGFWTGRFTAVKVLGKYLLLLVWPGGLSCDYSYNQIPLVSWRLDSPELWEAAAALAVCAAALAVAAFSHRRHKPLFFFIAFFFAALAPTANLVLLIGSIMAERFLYLPSLGFAGCLVWAVFTAAGTPSLRARLPRAAAPAALALVVVALASRTYVRNFDWRDDLSLWSSAARVSPNSYKVRMHLASAGAGAQGQGLDRAAAEADRALAILDPLPDDRNLAQPYSIAGFLYRSRGDFLASGQSRQWYQKSLDALLRGQRIDHRQFERVRRRTGQPGKPAPPTGWYPLYLELGDTCLRLGQPGRAVEAFEYGLRIAPVPELFVDLSAAHLARGDPQQAAVSLIEGLLVDSGSARLGSELMNLYRQGGPQSCAIGGAAGALGPNLACPMVHEQFCAASRNLARRYADTGKPTLAASTTARAVREFGCAAQTF
jgi:tetratricopeptide (TPR) repeat protein